MKFSSHYPFHFIIFSVFPVLSIYSFNIRIININEIFFPIIVILISSTLFWIFLSKILKNSFKAGIITTLGLFLFFTYGHIQKFLVGISFGEIDVGRPLFLSIIYVVFFVLGTILISKTKVNLKNVNIILNTTTFTMILIPLILIIPYSINTLDYSEIENDELVNLDDISTEFPDVYYILMDGYTSSSILKQQYGFDNSDFVNFLKKNEFHVPNSYGNYGRTSAGLTSLLNIDYVHNLKESTIYNNEPKFFSQLLNNRVMQEFKTNGYEVFNFYNKLVPYNFLNSDHIFCTENKIYNSELFIILVRTSMLAPLQGNIFEASTQDTILCIFDELNNIKEKSRNPIFVFAHIMLPHPPIIFGPNGEKVTPDSFDFDSGWNDKEGYVNQVQFGNKELKKIIEKLLSNSKIKPVIIIQGDHGGLLSYNKEMTFDEIPDKVIQDRLSVFSAYHLPEGNHPPYENMSNVNTFRLIFKNYFDDNVDLIEDRMFFSNFDDEHNFRDVTKIVEDTYK